MNHLFAKLDPLLMDFLNLPVLPTGEHRLTLFMVLHLVGLSFLLIYLCHALRGVLIKKILCKLRRLDIGTQHAFASTFSWLILCLGLLVIFDTAGIDITAITVFAGTIGIGVSMSLQTIATNVMSGVVILLERPIKVGDWVEIGNITGQVTDISLRSTSIITNDNIAVIVPNAEFVSSKVINWSYQDKVVRLKVELTVEKETDPEFIRQLLLNVASADSGVSKTPAPEVRLTGFGTSTMDFALYIWTDKHAGEPDRLQSDLNFKICAALKSAHLHIPVAECPIVATPQSMLVRQ